MNVLIGLFNKKTHTHTNEIQLNFDRLTWSNDKMFEDIPDGRRLFIYLLIKKKFFFNVNVN